MASKAKYLFICGGMESFFRIKITARQNDTMIKVRMELESVIVITSIGLE
jgi:hypothetical protein